MEQKLILEWGLFLGNQAWSFPSWTDYFTQRHFSYLHGTIKLCINVHWINKDSVWNLCTVHVNALDLHIKSSCWTAAVCLIYCINIHSAGIAEGLVFWWQTINRNLFRMSSAESIPFSAWWPSPCGARLTDSHWAGLSFRHFKTHTQQHTPA